MKKVFILLVAILPSIAFYFVANSEYGQQLMGVVSSEMQKTHAKQMNIVFDDQELEYISFLNIPPSDTEHFLEVNGSGARIDIFNNKNREAPIMLLLYGSTGLTNKARAKILFDHVDEAVAEGWVVVLPHYGDLPSDRWVNFIEASTQVAELIDNSNPEIIVAAGFSQGGFLGVQTTIEHQRFQGLALHSGFLSSWEKKENFKDFPPTLLTCGDQDPQYESMLQLEEWLTELNVPNRKIVAEGYGHSAPVSVHYHEWSETLKFFKKYVLNSRRANSKPLTLTSHKPEILQTFHLLDGQVIQGEVERETEDSYLVLIAKDEYTIIYKEDLA